MLPVDLNLPPGCAIDHIAIAVEDLDAGESLYSQFGLAAGRESIASEGVEVSFIATAGTRIELIRPLGPDTPVGRFLLRNGPGLHHIAIVVPNIDSTLEQLVGQGARLVGERVRTGAAGRSVAFLHPRSTGGVLIELIAAS